VVTVFLTLVHITDMYLDDGTTERTDAVEERDARMGVSTGIEHDAVVREAHLLHLVDELTLDVALIITDLYIGEQFLQLREICLETAVAIDAGLTYAQQVKVWSVYYLNLFHFCQQMINFDTKLKIKRDIAKQNR